MSAKSRGDRLVEVIRENNELRQRLHGMIRTNAELIERIEEDQAVYEQVINEQCAGDEVHCTCVPHLRKHIKELEAQLAERAGVCIWQPDVIGLDYDCYDSIKTGCGQSYYFEDGYEDGDDTYCSHCGRKIQYVPKPEPEEDGEG